MEQFLLLLELRKKSLRRGHDSFSNSEARNHLINSKPGSYREKESINREKLKELRLNTWPVMIGGTERWIRDTFVAILPSFPCRKLVDKQSDMVGGAGVQPLGSSFFSMFLKMRGSMRPQFG